MRIGVLMGGISSEREISLKSGEEVINNLDKEKYEVIPIIIDSKKDVIDKVKDIDFAFIALHGVFGEDGTVQGILETMGIPYSGCGVLSSSIAMNKDLCKRVMLSEKIDTAQWFVAGSLKEINYYGIRKMGYPVFVKPNNGGSSVATTLVEREEDLEDAVKEALKYDNEVIIEKYINGIEITSFVLNGEVMPTISIQSNGKNFFDYSSKYDEGGAEEKILRLNSHLQRKVDRISHKIWKVLRCKGYIRIDMILQDRIPYVLEVNTLPGLTRSSLIPKSAMEKGIDFPSLIDKMIEYSLD